MFGGSALLVHDSAYSSKVGAFPEIYFHSMVCPFLVLCSKIVQNNYKVELGIIYHSRVLVIGKTP